MESFENQVLLKITSADDPMIEAHGNEKEFDDDDVVERLILLNQSEIDPNYGNIVSNGNSEKCQVNNDVYVSIRQDEKSNHHCSSNSISPQSTVTQLTDTAINDDNIQRPSIKRLLDESSDATLMVQGANRAYKRVNPSTISSAENNCSEEKMTGDMNVDIPEDSELYGKQIHHTVNATEGGLSQKPKPNFKLTSIREIFAGSPSKGSKPKSSNAILRNKVKSFICCGKEGWRGFLRSKLPCITHARSYTSRKFIGDCIAGLTLALTVIPMGMGYAALAGLPLQYGLYASYIPGFMYAIFGTCKEVTIGPTAVNALMTYNYVGTLNTNMINAALTLGFFSGIIEIGTGALNLGFLTNFISAPVIAAFTSAVSINVMTSQIKGLLGLKKVPGRGFVNTWIAVFQNMTKIRPLDATIGFASLGVILMLRSIKKFKCVNNNEMSDGVGNNSRRSEWLKQAIWILTVSRNTIVLLLTSVLAYYLIEVRGMKDIIEVTGNVKGGIPSWQLPWTFTNGNSSFDSYDGTHNLKIVSNSSQHMQAFKSSEIDTLEGPWEIAMGIGSGLFFLPLVSMIQIIAIVHNFSPPTKPLQASQEILALGMCQLIGSFAGSLPITASFGRSTVNSASGVQTPFGGIITGIIVIAACSFLTPHFAFIPTASLSAVIISSVVLTIDVEILLPIWRSKKVDIIPYLITFFVGIFVSVEMGMIVGTSVHLLILLYSSSQPQVTIELRKTQEEPYILVQPDRSLNFPSVEKIRQKLSEASTCGNEVLNEYPNKIQTEVNHFHDIDKIPSDPDFSKQTSNGNNKNLIPIVFDLRRIVDMDFSTASLIRSLAKSIKERDGRHVLFFGASQTIEDVLQGVDAALFHSYSTIHEVEDKLIHG